MAGTIKGIIVEIGGDTSGLQKALKNVNSATSSLTKELRGVNSLLKLDPTNTELVTQKQKILAQNIEETSEKLKLLKETQQKADEAIANGTEISDANYRNLQREIINTENKLKDLKVEASNWTTAGRAIEEYGTKIQNLGNKIDSIGNKLTTRLTLPLVALGVAGVQSAASQEAAMQQVELIYGDASDAIKNFAENTAISYNMSTQDAYKYSQIYGNLIQSITDDEEENALYTQQLLKASSVIASATGRTMEDVMDRIRSGLLGNTEAIEDLGVNVNVAMLESTDSFKKFAGDKSWKQLDFQTQQQIRLFAILEQTTKKYGKEVNKNTASDIQKLTAKFKNLTGELSKKLLPIADKLIDKADKFLDKIGDLTDEEQENIIKTGIMVAAAGPLVKILGTTTKVIGGTAKGIGIFSQAIAVATNKTTSNVTSVNNLAKAFGALTSPMGIVLAATAGAVGIGLVLSNEQYAYADSINESTKKMNEAIESQRQFRQAQDETLNSTLTEADNVQKLSDELQTLVDKNGKVKEGYEGRVNFILNELNGALGTEYKLNGKVVDSYDEIIKSIDDLIQKKRINAILENEEAKYNEAMDKKTDAYNDMIAKEEELATAKQRVIDAQKLVDDFDYSKGNASLKAYYDNQLGLAKHMQSEAENNLNNSKNLYHTYLDDIATYQNDYEIAMSGSTEKINELINSKTYTYQQSSNDIGEVINHNIQQVQYEVEQYKLAREEDLRNQDETNAQKNQKQIEAGEKQLETLAQQLTNMTSTTEELTPQQLEAWKNLASNSYSIYSEYVSKLAPEMQKKIQEATGVVIANTPEFAKQAGIMGEKVVAEFDKNTEAKKEALDTLQGYYEGLNDKEKNELLKKTVGDKAEEVAKQFEKGDYETSGKNVLEGIYDGLNNRTLGQTLINKAAGIARSIANQFNIQWDEHSPSKLMKKKTEYLLEPIGTVFSSRERELINNAKNLAQNIVGGFSNSFKFNKMTLPISNIKSANALNSNILKESKNIFTTPQIVFNVQELDEAKLEQCFNYINRKFGTQY